MIYRQGKTGRVFVARMENGDNLIESIKQMAEKEAVQAGIIYIIGALKDASLVVGPEKCSLPPEPVWRKFDDCREIIGIGTLFRENGEPLIHLHGSLGKGDITLMGCIRGEARVYLVAELIIVELMDTGAVRKLDPVSGLKILDFLPN